VFCTHQYPGAPGAGGPGGEGGIGPDFEQSAVTPTSYCDLCPVSPIVVYSKFEVGPPATHVIRINPSRSTPPLSVCVIKLTLTLSRTLLFIEYVSTVPWTFAAASHPSATPEESWYVCAICKGGASENENPIPDHAHRIKQWQDALTAMPAPSGKSDVEQSL
jgi:hypothetical protein